MSGPACTRPLRRSPCDGRPTGATRPVAGSGAYASAAITPGFVPHPRVMALMRWLVRLRRTRARTCGGSLALRGRHRAPAALPRLSIRPLQAPLPCRLRDQCAQCGALIALNGGNIHAGSATLPHGRTLRRCHAPCGPKPRGTPAPSLLRATRGTRLRRRCCPCRQVSRR